MGQFPTGVCVVAVVGDDGAVSAMTINSFVSVSLEPLLVCWSLHNDSSRFDQFTQAKRFTISVLEAGQGEQALAYSSRASKGVRDGDFGKTDGGFPVVAGSLACFECEAFATHAAGDHTMILGKVTGLSASAEADSKALGFFNGEFCAVPAE